MEKPIKLATAFSGGLAAPEFALRYENIAHEVVFACEWDKYARAQYLEFHGEPQTFYEDISDLNAIKYKDQIDLFVWGSPCQDLSLAGKRKGFDGEKSSLFREGARVMSEMMPKAFIFENVKGLLSSNNGNDYKEVVKTFLDMGYLIAMKVLNAKEHGTVQNRERVFIVGFLDEDAYHSFSFEDTVPLTKTLKDYIDDEVDEKYYLSEKLVNTLFKTSSGKDGQFKPAKCCNIESISPTITARYYKLGRQDPYIKEPQINQVGTLDIKGSDSVKRVYGADGLSPTLTTMGGGNRQPKVLVPTVGIKSATKTGFELATPNDSINFTHPNSTTRRGRVGVGVAQTLDCACNQGVMETIKRWSIFPYRIRKFTPIECFRLQGVRDKDINLVNSNTQSYKIAGNAIEVNSMRSIIRALFKPVKNPYSLF